MRHRRILVFALGVCLWAAGSLLSSAQPGPSYDPNLTEEQKRDFLLNAKVIASKRTSKGITSPWHLTLSDGKITHDAHFQSVEVRKTSETMSDGRTELNFRDSYHYNIAAYELAKLLGMSDMVPLALERKWNGERGAIAWWVPMKWDEGKRLKQNLKAPDPDGWNKQMYKIRVFDELVYDTDPNLTNVLITEDWKIWRADFTRAFRLNSELQSTKDLPMCDRQLLQKLRELNGAELLEKTKPHLTKPEVAALMARRDKIVAHFQQLIAEKGEGAVLY